MKRESSIRALVVPCRFRGEPGRFRIHVGVPAAGFGAVHFQAAWLRETRDGEIDPKVLEELNRLLKGSRV